MEDLIARLEADASEIEADAAYHMAEGAFHREAIEFIDRYGMTCLNEVPVNVMSEGLRARLDHFLPDIKGT
jgi:hypothetical protein